ncbi:MAG: DUF4286 family protein [Myxococcota bacterium]
MLIYEVNLTVQPSIADAMERWLTSHFNDMLAIDGFEQVTLYSRRPEDEGAPPDAQLRWTCHYRVRDRASLDRYLAKDAARMRQEGLDLFGGQFTASRRILATQATKQDDS